MDKPIKVIQFGEGNFLRAFVDWMIHNMNKSTEYSGSVCIVQPIEKGLVDLLEEQNYEYNHYMVGIKDSKPIKKHYKNTSVNMVVNPYKDYEKYISLAKIDSVNVIVSNTTEAGIEFVPSDKKDSGPNVSFPAKLTNLLYERYKYTKGNAKKGYRIIPCELINKNGDKLKDAILKYIDLWDLSYDFKKWFLKANTFTNTLVDRIVPGYPKDKIGEITKELGYEDKLVVESEIFNLWVIEDKSDIKEVFPVHKYGGNAIFVKDMSPYRTRKVRILNGAHTSLVPVGLLYGLETVRECVEDEVMGNYLKDTLYNEIIPTLTLPKEELVEYTKEVLERFKNPYIKHYLISISLNSMSKYKTRVLPSLIEYYENNKKLPKHLCFSLASYIVLYYKKNFEINDDKKIIDLYKKAYKEYDGSKKSVEKLTSIILGYKENWNMNLNDIEGLTEKVSNYVHEILSKGMKNTLEKYFS